MSFTKFVITHCEGTSKYIVVDLSRQMAVRLNVRIGDGDTEEKSAGKFFWRLEDVEQRSQ